MSELDVEGPPYTGTVDDRLVSAEAEISLNTKPSFFFCPSGSPPQEDDK